MPLLAGLAVDGDKNIALTHVGGQGARWAHVCNFDPASCAAVHEADAHGHPGDLLKLDLQGRATFGFRERRFIVHLEHVFGTLQRQRAVRPFSAHNSVCQAQCQAKTVEENMYMCQDKPLPVLSVSACSVPPGGKLAKLDERARCEHATRIECDWPFRTSPLPLPPALRGAPHRANGMVTPDRGSHRRQRVVSSRH